MDLRNSWSAVHSTVECRAGGLDEYPAAAQLRGEMAREMGADFDALARDWQTAFCAYYGGKQAGGSAQLFLAFDGHTPIGCAIVTLTDDYRRYCFGIATAHVNAVYVRPAYRRRGVARRLMEMAREWARQRKCARIRLRASDDGRPLYESLGFRHGREMELDL